MTCRALILAIGLGLGPLLAAGPAAALSAPPSDSAAQGEARTNVRVSSRNLPNDLTASAEAAASEFQAPSTPYVDLPNINVPVVRGGQLIGYAFVVMRLHLAEGADEWRVRDRSHFLLDTAVRAAHALPYESLGGEEVDPSALAGELESRLEAVLDSPLIERVELLGGDLRLVSL